MSKTWLLLAHRLGTFAAEAWWSVGPADLEVAHGIGRAFPDGGFSIVDRTSFAVMQRLGVLRAATFDRHFAVFRFGRRLDRAFQIVA